MVFEVENEQLDAIVTPLVAAMTSAADLDVPLIVDVGMGKNWDEAH